MKKVANLKFALFVGFALLLLAGCTPGGSNSDIDTKALAQCLTDQGITMYGTDTCPHCLRQKDLFGENFSLLNYVDCTQDPDACASQAIKGIPAWIMTDGSRLQGLQSLEVLIDKSGCE